MVFNSPIYERYYLFSQNGDETQGKNPKNKEGIIQRLNVNVGSKNYNRLRKYFDVFNNTFIQWKGNFRTGFNLIHIVNEES